MQNFENRTAPTHQAEPAADQAAFHRQLATLLLREHDFRGAYYEASAALRLASTNAESQVLYKKVLQTQGIFVRCLLRVHTYLITSVLCRALALVVFMAWMLLIAFVAEMLLPAEMRYAWVMAFLFGFLALVSIISDPEPVTNFIWFFANSGSAVPHSREEVDAGREHTADGREIRL